MGAGRPTYGYVLAALGVLAVAAYGAGLYELPDWGELVREAPDRLGDATYGFAGGMAVLELGTLLGVALPFEVGVILSGAVAGEGEIALLPLLSIVWVCACVAESANYLTGRRFGRPFLERHGERFRLTPGRLAWLDRHFERHGRATVFFGHVIPFVRSSAPFFAGASLMSYRSFLPWSVAGNALFAAVFGGLGYLFYRSAGTVADASDRAGLAVLGLLFVAALALVVRRLIRARRRAYDP